MIGGSKTEQHDMAGATAKGNTVMQPIPPPVSSLIISRASKAVGPNTILAKIK